MEEQIGRNKKGSLLQYGLLAIIVLIIYGSTTTFEYVLDDALYISDNSFTKKGIGGIVDHLKNESLVGYYGYQNDLLSGGRYRPLAPITYAIEYAIYGFNPSYSHIINILLYTILLMLLMKVVDRFNQSKEALLGIIVVILFAVHPLHVEVVANIKGRDQILALIAVLSTTLISFRYFGKNMLSLFLMMLIFFLGLLAKENTITFLPIIPLAHYFFNDKKIKEIAPLFLSLFVAAGLWLVLRFSVIQGFESVESEILLNDPFLMSNTNERLATIVYTWLLYLKLLLVPFPLTYDYYPFHIPIRSFSNVWSVLSLLIHLGLGIYAIVQFKKKDFFSFIIIFYASTFSISSNLFFNIGTFMNERFMFEPSIAFCLLIGFLIIRFLPNKWGGVSFVIIVCTFGVISFNRSFAWKDNYTLFTTDVKVSQNSIKSLMASGGVMTERAKTLNDTKEKNELLGQAISNLSKAARLFPEEQNAFRLLGIANYEKNGPGKETVAAFLKVLDQSPSDQLTIRNVEWIVSNKEISPKTRLEFALPFEPYMKSSFAYHYQVGLIYGQGMGDLPRSILYLKKAESIEADNILLLKNLGAALAIAGDYSQSNEYLLTAESIDPNDLEVLSNIGLNYQNLGQEREAQLYFDRLSE